MTEIKKEEVKSGMTIRVYQKLKEDNKEKTHIIEGLVIARKHFNEPGATITLRKIIDGVGVEWILPLFSPKIEKIELLKEGKTRRNKLYYIREKSQAEIRKKLKAELKKSLNKETLKKEILTNSIENQKDKAQVAELADAQD